IWAYLHAAVKTPEGLRFPAGSYISWAHQGPDLLSEQDVSFLASTTNEALLDAEQTTEVYGPTLVYCRDAMAWQTRNAPHRIIKEFIDEQAGSVMKWPVPIFSITRAEYLPRVQSDLFILQTPVHLKEETKKCILGLMDAGQPVAVFASPAGGLDPDIAARIGIRTADSDTGAMREKATLVTREPYFADGVPPGFRLFHPFTHNTVSGGPQVVYAVDGSPALLLNTDGGRNLLFWDPTDFVVEPFPEEGTWNAHPLVDLMGSAFPFVLVARGLNRLLKGTSSPCVQTVDVRHTVCVGAWRVKDGSYRILAGNLEEGLTHDADMSRQTVLHLPGTWFTGPTTLHITDRRHGEEARYTDANLEIRLAQAECTLFEIRPVNEDDPAASRS
ncbi:MAG: hypothetical protein HQ559_13235, partial [Lentisphaerae bacterium]|nr:hypothetical protein [Lentisphaerota bacterium]